MARTWLLGCIAALVVGCGHHSGNTGDDDANGPTDDSYQATDPVDSYVALIDAPPFSGMCNMTSGTQCANCVDDDGDGKIDGFDPECTGPADNDEASFKTGIPGDNIDAPSQDCFFDGNSGSGDDGCNEHTCCLLQAPDKATCHMEAPSANQNK